MITSKSTTTTHEPSSSQTQPPTPASDSAGGASATPVDYGQGQERQRRGCSSRLLHTDLTSHVGLRGVAATWILLYHCFDYSTAYVDFQGSSIMPLFLMLSGFTLAVCYGQKQWRLTGPTMSCDWELDNQEQDESTSTTTTEEEEEGRYKALLPLQPFNATRFYLNRFARIMPTYYLCNLLMVPPLVVGYSNVYPLGVPAQAITTLIPISSLFSCMASYPPDAASWTVTTLTAFWALFPRWLTRAQRQSDDQLIKSIVWWYYIQLLLAFLCYYLTTPLTNSPMIGLAAATMNPLTRFPLFLMGLYAGLLCLRHPSRHLPWPSSLAHALPRLTSSTPSLHEEREAEEERERTRWHKIADYQGAQLLFATLLVTLIDHLLEIHNGPSPLPGALPLPGRLWFQGVVPFAQLEAIVAFTRDRGQSLASKALRTPLATWLGKISAALYLVHLPVLNYAFMALHGDARHAVPAPECQHLPYSLSPSCQAQWHAYRLKHEISPRTIPIVVVCSLVAACVIYCGFEEPIRRKLKRV